MDVYVSCKVNWFILVSSCQEGVVGSHLDEICKSMKNSHEKPLQENRRGVVWVAVLSLRSLCDLCACGASGGRWGIIIMGPAFLPLSSWGWLTRCDEPRGPLMSTSYGCHRDLGMTVCTGLPVMWCNTARHSVSRKPVCLCVAQRSAALMKHFSNTIFWHLNAQKVF